MPVAQQLHIKPLGRAFVPLWTDASKCWCVRDHWFYRFDYASGKLSKVFRLPPSATSMAGRLKDAMARSSLRQWLQPRAGIHHLVELPSGEVFVLYDKIYRYTPAKGHGVAQVLDSRFEPGLAWPLRGGVAVHPVSGNMYFGEYNDDPRGVRVIRVSPALDEAVVCWHFARTEVRHIHAIHHDPFRQRLWICTGDRDHESVIWYTDDEFQTVHRFAGGDQTWRAIAMLFDETGMEWGMDAGQDAPAQAINRIFRYDFSTGQRTERAVTGNPVYAACAFDDGSAVMQASFEPQRKQDTPAEAALWWRDRQGEWGPLFQLPFQEHKPCGVGRYGHLLLPIGRAPAGQLLCTPVNTAEHTLSLLLLQWDRTRIS